MDAFTCTCVKLNIRLTKLNGHQFATYNLHGNASFTVHLVALCGQTRCALFFSRGLIALNELNLQRFNTAFR